MEEENQETSNSLSLGTRILGHLSKCPQCDKASKGRPSQQLSGVNGMCPDYWEIVALWAAEEGGINDIRGPESVDEEFRHGWDNSEKE